MNHDRDLSLGSSGWLLLISTLMLSGRAMTLAFLGQVGGSAPGAPPAAWLMPLAGDALIGLGALGVAALLVWGRSLLAWALAVTWNAIGIWDALSAFLVHHSVPWPDFFMVQIFGSSMFFAACGMHAMNLWLLSRPHIRDRFGSMGVARLAG